MAKRSKNSGFQSAAGLVRYFDSEDDKSPKIDPWLVVAIAVVSSVVIELLRIMYPT